MSIDEAGAKAILAALLDTASGQVGEFIPMADVITCSGLDGSRAAAALEVLTTRRWVHIRDGSVAATKWGLEFGMDWTNVAVVLRAILNSAGKIGRAAEMEVVIAASGLPEQEVERVLNELATLGLAHHCLIEHENGPATMGAGITSKGWDYLTNGCSEPQLI
jgi:hypothetical protein